MQEKKIKQTFGNKEGKIDELIRWLEAAKEEGATNYKMEWTNDPVWSFKWFTAYRFKSEKEVKLEKIEKLKKEIKDLEDSI